MNPLMILKRDDSYDKINPFLIDRVKKSTSSFATGHLPTWMSVCRCNDVNTRSLHVLQDSYSCMDIERYVVRP